MPPLPPLNPPWSWRVFETGARLFEWDCPRAALTWTNLGWEVWRVEPLMLTQQNAILAHLSVDGVRPERLPARLEQVFRRPVCAPTPDPTTPTE